MGYKVGDKFIIEIKEVLSSEKGTLYRSNFSTLVFDDYGLDHLQKYDEVGHKLELIDELKLAEYNRGMNDAWKVLKHIQSGELTEKEIRDLWGLDIIAFANYFTEHYIPQHAIAKLEAYEKSKEQICVGDVVSNPNFGEAVILEAKDNGKYNLFSDGKVLLGWDGFALKKTGKQINIEILKTIGKEN